mgnify:CR=1 FL=1
MTQCADCCYAEPKGSGMFCRDALMPCFDLAGCERGIKKPTPKPKRDLSEWESAWVEWAKKEEVKQNA